MRLDALAALAVQREEAIKGVGRHDGAGRVRRPEVDAHLAAGRQVDALESQQ